MNITLKSTLIILFIAVCPFAAKSQISFQQLREGMQETRKYILMYISSETCIHCPEQDAALKRDKALYSRLSKELYFLNWSMEKTDNFYFAGKDFEKGHLYKSGGIEFAEEYGRDEKGHLATPLWILFDPFYRVIYRHNGVLPSEGVHKLLDIIIESNKQMR